MCTTSRFARTGATVAVSLSVAACIPLINNPDYPRDWPAQLARAPDACPAIAGTYSNAGRLALEAGIPCKGRKQEGQWSCSLSLAVNLGLLGNPKSVRIEQPDAKTLSVTLLGEEGPPGDTRVLTLKAGKDFECAAGRLKVSETRSIYPSAGMTVLAAMLATGGVVHHQRSFAPDADGGLVMTVEDSVAGFHVVIGAVTSATSYVRWVKAGAEDATPSAAR